MAERSGIAGSGISTGFEAFIPFLEGAGSEPDNPESRILSRLEESPVPPAMLLTFAARAGFEGIPVLKQAALAAGDNSLFGPPENREPNSCQGPSDLSGSTGQHTLESVFETLFERLGERRDQQIRMARSVMDTLREEKITLIEAGTGTGKSLAYLVPSAIFAMEAGERIVVSTHTRNLQNQLYEREIELVRDALAPGIRAARLVGRENYICAKRLISEVSRLGGSDPPEALRLALSAAFASGGTVDEAPAECRGSISAPSRCRMNRCGYSENCPLLKARKKASEADILFVNHALALADYSGGGRVLGGYHSIIFDEAHHLERSVMENLSVSVSPGDVSSVLEWIRPIDPEEERWKFLVNELEAASPGGEWKEVVKRASSLAAGTERQWRSIFRDLNSELNSSGGLSSVKKRYYDGDETFGDVRGPIDSYLSYNKQLCDSLNMLIKVEAESGIRSFQQEIEIAGSQLAEISEAAGYLTGVLDDEVVYWIEWNSRGRIAAICGSPLRVDRRFADFLTDSCRSAVLTSATISQNGSFDYISGCLGTGLTGREVNGYIEPSTLVNDRNCRIILRSDLQNPNLDSFSERVAELIRELSRNQGRRILALFTSYRMCNLTAEQLKGGKLAGPLLVQGEGLSRDLLSERFRSSSGAVLLGVASFWEGVDFPGTQLEILIIPKIPFPVPTDPMVEARTDMIRRTGGNPFTGLFLPEAILRLRQGIGRLIRGAADRGVVVILDSRIQVKSYGRQIIDSLPTEPLLVFSGEEVVSESEAFFDKGGS